MKMAVNIYVDFIGGNYVGAVAEGNKLIEYRVEKKSNSVTVGSVYKGRVTKVLAGMQAAFVDIGLEKNGYLSLDDMLMDRSELEGKAEFPRIEIKEGDEILVQAVKDPVGTKGVRLSPHVSFAGRFAVLIPNIDFLGVSRKITDEKTRERLLSLASKVKADDLGIIIRTAAEEAKPVEVKREIKQLKKKYDVMRELYQKSPAPCCVHEEGNLVYRLLRDVYGSDTEKVVVADEEIYDKIKDYAVKVDRSLKRKLKLFTEGVDMFKYYGLSKDVDIMLDGKVYLDGGAYIVIDKAEALTVIDVNTGGYVGKENLEETVFHTNLVAAEEIARQIRLRNIAGIIVVDFIDMEEEEHRKKLLEALGKALSNDRVKCNLVGMTGLGLVEITRKKKRKESVSMLQKSCPYCQGTGQIHSNDFTVMKIRTALLDLFADGYENATVDLNVEIADYILSKKILKKDVEKIYKGKRIYIIPHKTYHQHFFIVKGDNSTAMDLPDKAVLLY